MAKQAARSSSHATGRRASRSNTTSSSTARRRRSSCPFVMGVMADLSGKPAEPLAPVADRKFLEIDVDNFDSRMKSMKPRVAFQVPNTLDRRGQHQRRHDVREHGRLLARRGGAQGRCAQQAARGTAAAGEPDHLHGRQDGRRGADRQGAATTRRC